MSVTAVVVHDICMEGALHSTPHKLGARIIGCDIVLKEASLRPASFDCSCRTHPALGPLLTKK
jgi:hypothetical protein